MAVSNHYNHWWGKGILLGSIGISRIGDFIYLIAINILILNMTGSPAAVAGLWIIAPLASVLTKFWSGSIVDRYNQRQLMILTDIIRAILVAILPILPELWMMYVCLMFVSMASSIFQPASQVYIVRLVPEEDRKQFNAFQGLTTSGAFLIGPAITGIMLMYTTPDIAIYINAASFLFSALLLFFLPRLDVVEVDPGVSKRLTVHMIKNDWIEVLRFSRMSFYVMFVYCLYHLILLLGMALDSQEVVFIRQTLDLSELEYGVIVSLTGAGSVAGAFVNSLLAKWMPLKHMLGGGMLLVSVGYLIFSVSGSFTVATAGFMILGFFSSFSNTGMATFYQNNVPAELMGRITSAFGLLISLLQIVAIVTFGVIAELFSLRLVYLSVSVVLILLSFLLWGAGLKKSTLSYYEEKRTMNHHL
ncbi:MFS transporter [Paenibacillus sp. Marseille-Q4541]|uniref:MFS transporter n=1 Tax=Paenibacillus sp. Marseille-Q4541 TaxID=2831522 RepID=UPI001BAAB18C|nr:MFS transporter [Paenibacillus sp. Marseille-Q4541]